MGSSNLKFLNLPKLLDSLAFGLADYFRQRYLLWESMPTRDHLTPDTNYKSRGVLKTTLRLDNLLEEFIESCYNYGLLQGKATNKVN